MPTDLTGTPTSLGIGTYNVDADAPSGLGFNAAMAQIDALIAARATLASPAFTGTPTAPTPAPGDVSTKIATTSFVATSFAPLASPTFTGTPSAPTPATADNSTKLATTAFVKAQGYLTSVGTVVNTFNGRSGAVSPTSGDYTAAQVTNAADKSSASTQTFSAGVQSSEPTLGVGYATGAGGTVTQTTNRTTGVTLNKVVGRVSTNNASMASGASVTFTVSNSTVTSTDIIALSAQGPPGRYYVSQVANGSFDITYVNDGAGNFISIVNFLFAVVKGAIS